MHDNNIKIRTVNINDAEAILKIYEYYVKNTAVTFEYDVPSLIEFKKRIANTLKKYPYFVAVSEDRIIGYAYAGPFVGRAAYGWSAELTVYIDPNERNRGAGKMLYDKLSVSLFKMGILNLYACIGYPETEDEYLTQNSAKFHENLGFTKVGEFYKCGYKFQRWYNMIWMEKIIGKHKEHHGAVKCFSQTDG